jgi:hypothetical protein
MKRNAAVSRAPEQLIQYARARSTAFVAKIQKAMTVIENEIQENEGLYPYNGGRLSQAELCRRASVTNAALQAPSHKETTRKWVEKWIAGVHRNLTTGKKVVRKAVTDRAESWKAQHSTVATAYTIVILELSEKEQQIEALETENARLRTELSNFQSLKVIPISKKKAPH